MKIKYHKTLFIASGFGLLVLLGLFYFPFTVQARERQINNYGYQQPRVFSQGWGHHRYVPPPVRVRPDYNYNWHYYHRPYHNRYIHYHHGYRDGYRHGHYPRTY